MKTFKPTLHQAFNAMLNGNKVLLSEKERVNHLITEDVIEFQIEHIDQNHQIALFSEQLDEVIYDIGCDDILIIITEPKKLGYVCQCNKCSALLNDDNPTEATPKIELTGKELNMVQVLDAEDYIWACPNCLTDAYLSDTITA